MPRKQSDKQGIHISIKKNLIVHSSTVSKATPSQAKPSGYPRGDLCDLYSGLICLAFELVITIVYCPLQQYRVCVSHRAQLYGVEDAPGSLVARQRALR